MLAEEKRSNRLWAIKVLKKEFIIENDEIERYVMSLVVRRFHWDQTDLHIVFAAPNQKSESSSLLLENGILSCLTFILASKLKPESTL